ncbi:hypothetical protein [Mesorhizobium sp.]|uniref:hypothetical protein n=1 Tax=Mesorhizobium sp. TaxID=1871066 RepID=UPI000FEA6851|nr:hypothetical protein [Mesorhizobium sp.]RWE87012.1 MAG: hypothetical protein EOS49_12300 [Mesorhizobium sp.]TIS62447.1 MAG: hypothetical protein E5W92_31035 [Mesorhizobium sp.]
MNPKTEIDRSVIGPDTPFRLGVAAAVAFLDGIMGERCLRRAVNRGLLAVETIGNRYTTLRDIEKMRQLCREGA